MADLTAVSGPAPHLSGAVLPRAADRLLAAARRRLYRRRAARILAMAAWIVAASACGAAAVHLLHRALGPAALLIPTAVVAGAALACTIIRAPSPLDAAAFIDDALEGRFAYRTLLELTEAAWAESRGPDPVASAAFLEWVSAHALQAEPELRSRPPTPWPRAALASATTALLLAAALLQLPGAVSRTSTAMVSGGVSVSGVPPFAGAAVQRASRDESSRRDDRAAQATPAHAMAGTAPEVAAAHNSSPRRSDSDTPADRAGPLASERSASVLAEENPATNAGGIQAGTAPDALIAAQLARAARLAPIERLAVTPATSPAASRRGGDGFGNASAAEPSQSAVGFMVGQVAAAQPPHELDPAISGPVAQVLIGRYFASIGREAPGKRP